MRTKPVLPGFILISQLHFSPYLPWSWKHLGLSSQILRNECQQPQVQCCRKGVCQTWERWGFSFWDTKQELSGWDQVHSHSGVVMSGTAAKTACIPPSWEMPGPDFWPRWEWVLLPEPQTHLWEVPSGARVMMFPTMPLVGDTGTINKECRENTQNIWGHSSTEAQNLPGEVQDPLDPLLQTQEGGSSSFSALLPRLPDAASQNRKWSLGTVSPHGWL